MKFVSATAFVLSYLMIGKFSEANSHSRGDSLDGVVGQVYPSYANKTSSLSDVAGDEDEALIIEIKHSSLDGTPVEVATEDSRNHNNYGNVDGITGGVPHGITGCSDLLLTNKRDNRTRDVRKMMLREIKTNDMAKMTVVAARKTVAKKKVAKSRKKSSRKMMLG